MVGTIAASIVKFSHVTPILRSLLWLKLMNELNINSSHSPIKFSQSVNLTNNTDA